MVLGGIFRLNLFQGWDSLVETPHLLNEKSGLCISAAYGQVLKQLVPPKLEKYVDSAPGYWKKTWWRKLTSSEMELGRLLRSRECPRWGGPGLWGQNCSQRLDCCPLWSWSMRQFVNLKHIFQPYGIFLMVCSQQSSIIIVNRCSFCPISQGIKINAMFEHVCFPTHCWSYFFP